MTIRYNCPGAASEGAYMLLDTNTRTGVGYYEDGTIRWSLKPITVAYEREEIKNGVWILPELKPEERLPEGF